MNLIVAAVQASALSPAQFQSPHCPWKNGISFAQMTTDKSRETKGFNKYGCKRDN